MDLVQGYVNVGLLVLGFVIGYFVGRKHGNVYKEILSKIERLEKIQRRVKRL